MVATSSARTPSGPRPTWASAEIVFAWVRCSMLVTGQVSPYGLRMGRSIELTADGRLLARWMLDVSRFRTAGTDFNEIRRDYEAPVGSVEQERMLDRFARDLGQQLPKALAVFAENAPGSAR